MKKIGSLRIALRTLGLKKKQKILKRAEYIRLSQCGNKIQDRCFIVIYEKADKGFPRIGITASRRVGGAVVRNRIKRLVREWFRLHQGTWDGCWNVNVIAKKTAADLSLNEVMLSLEKIMNQVEDGAH